MDRLAWQAEKFFFFQAEDGIRYLYVTGVQTCALPIWPGRSSGSFSTRSRPRTSAGPPDRNVATRRGRSLTPPPGPAYGASTRSEERRVGKERRSGGTV